MAINNVVSSGDQSDCREVFEGWRGMQMFDFSGEQLVSL